MLRSFIAIEIPAEIQKAILEKTAVLRQAFNKHLIRWVPQENIHLTMKFLGDVSPANLDSLVHNLVPELNQFPRFDMRAGGIGAFPNPRRPRVLWIGIEAPKGLTDVAHTIETVASRFGFAPEARPFSPHLTIGRIDQHASGNEMQQIRMGLERTKIGYLGTTAIQSVDVFSSDLRPSGAIYTKLYTIPFSIP